MLEACSALLGEPVLARVDSGLNSPPLMGDNARALRWSAVALTAMALSFVASYVHGRRRGSREWHHGLYRAPQVRMTYNIKDFTDYALMLALTAALAHCSFGAQHVFSQLAFGCCSWLLCAFAVRHGVSFRVPSLLTDPWGLPWVLLQKLDNVRPSVLACMCTLAVEQAAIALTPTWPHMSSEAAAVFSLVLSATFWAISAFRLAILLAHIWHRNHVFAYLQRTNWGKMIAHTSTPRQLLDLSHAFFTGLLCHLLAVAPLYLAIDQLAHSLVFAPVRLGVNAAALWWFWKHDFNEWLHRDHWVCHHHELAFLYLHGPHHDALPVSMMAAHDTGMLEGFLRFGASAVTNRTTRGA